MSDSCSCGFGVANCNNDPQSLYVNYVLATVFHVALFIVTNKLSDLPYFIREQKMVQASEIVTSFIPWMTERRLFTLRFVEFGLFVWTMFDMPIVYGVLPIATFTVWNWIVVGCYLFSAQVVTLQLWKYLPLLPFQSRLNGLVGGIFQLEFIGATYVTIIVWSLLLPVSFTIDSEDSLLNRPSYLTHGANFIFMLNELLFSRLQVERIAMIWFLLWINVYGFFHAIFMVIKEICGYKPCPMYPFLSVASPFYLPCLLLFTFFSFLIAVLAFKVASCKRYWLNEEDVNDKSNRSNLVSST